MTRKEQQVLYRTDKMGNVAAILLEILAFKTQRLTNFAKIRKFPQGKRKAAGAPLAELAELVNLESCA